MKRWLGFLLCLLSLLCAGCGTDTDFLLLSAEETAKSVQGERNETADQTEADRETVPEPSDSDQDAVIYVYICGAVNAPGVYELEAESRVFQLVEKAGGATAEADTDKVNLAEHMTDGQMIRIPVTGEEPEPEETSQQMPADALAAKTADGRININTASAQELTALSGIGESKANAIISYREKHGAFQNVEEIMQVDGIAEGTYEKLKDRISVK